MDKKEKRLLEFKSWIKAFTVYHNLQKKDIDLIFINNAAEILNYRYWEYAENYIRPIINDEINEQDLHDESKISRFKIVSATELTIIDVQPIVINGNPKLEKEINAEFGWFVGYSILIDFSEEPIPDSILQFLRDYKESIPGVDTSKIVSIFEEHIEWLCNLSLDVQIPVISNAQTWRLFYFSLLALDGKIKM